MSNATDKSYTLILTKEEFLLIQKSYLMRIDQLKSIRTLNATDSAEYWALDALHEGPVHDAWHRDDLP